MMEEDRHFKLNLAAARANKSLTRKEAAAAVGIDARSLAGYESGRTCITAITLRRLCKLYGIPEQCIILPEEVEGLNR